MQEWWYRAVRQLGLGVPFDCFFGYMRAYAEVRAVLRYAFRGVGSRDVPGCLAEGGRVSPRALRKSRYLNEVLKFFPDRLGEAEWLERCRFVGLEQVVRAWEARRPAVLAFSHMGPFPLLRRFLRAAGVPVVTLVRGLAEERTRVERMQDEVSPFPEVPTVVHQDELREAMALAAAGYPLQVAMDGPLGRQIEVPAGEGWTFRMASGPMRLAARHGAELYPCVIFDEGHWRFCVEIGRPVPAKYLAGEGDWVGAGAHILGEMLPRWRAWPDQCPETYGERFQREGRAAIMSAR